MSFLEKKNQIRVPAQSNSRATHHVDKRTVVSKSKGAMINSWLENVLAKLSLDSQSSKKIEHRYVLSNVVKL